MPNVVQKVLSTIGKGLGQTTPYSLPKYSGREVIYNTTLVLRHAFVTPGSRLKVRRPQYLYLLS